MPERPSMLKPALIGGASAGLASGLPFIGAVNCACCALIVGGGFFAAYLYSQACSRAGLQFRPGTGAGVGLFAGVFCALVGSVVSAVFSRVNPDQIDQIMEQLDQADVPPEVADTVVRLMEMSGSAIGILISFVFFLLLGAIFSTIGGLIGGAVFKVEAAPPISEGTAPTPPTAP